MYSKGTFDFGDYSKNRCMYIWTKKKIKTLTNSADPDQTAPKEQSDLGLHCLPFHPSFF